MTSKPIRVSKDFYSNCFLTTVIHKVLHWKNTKVIYIPRKYNGFRVPHMMWQDKKTNKFFEFTSCKDSPNLIMAIFEKGYIQEVPEDRHKLIVQMNFKTFMNKMENKYQFTSKESEYQKFYEDYSWHETAFYGLPNENVLGDTNLFIGKTPNKEIKLFSINDIPNLCENDVIEWKII